MELVAELAVDPAILAQAQEIVADVLEEANDSSDEENLDEFEAINGEGIKRRRRRPGQPCFKPAYYYPLDKPAAVYNKGVPVSARLHSKCAPA